MRLFQPDAMELTHVAVFEHPGVRCTHLTAYTQWYSPDWEGCCMHHIHGPRREAKRRAIAEHREKCMGGRK